MRILKSMEVILSTLRKTSSAAILLDNVSLTALQWFVIHEKVTYNDVFRLFYDALYELNIECDILSVDDVNLFGQYKILVTPALYSVSDSLVEHLKRYVAEGGVLLSSFKTAVADRMLKIYHDDQPHGLTEVFGMTYDQFTDAVNVDLKDLDFPLTDETEKNHRPSLDGTTPSRYGTDSRQVQSPPLEHLCRHHRQSLRAGIRRVSWLSYRLRPSERPTALCLHQGRRDTAPGTIPCYPQTGDE